MVWQRRVRGGDQRGDEGDHPRVARRGIPVGRAARALSQVRTRGDGRGSMGQSVLTTGFARVDGVLHCEGVSLERIAADVGTPVYVYSAATIRDRYERLDRMLAPV